MRTRVPAPIVTAAALAAALLPAAPAKAEIYRCVEDGAGGTVTVFSDLPCDAGASVHRAVNGNLSVVAAPDNLDRIIQRNREFVDQRQRALERARERAARQAREAAARQAAAERLARRYDDDRFHHTLPQRFPIQDQRALGSDAARSAGRSSTDPRVRQRADGNRATDRGTLLSRSGGNRKRILQR